MFSAFGGVAASMLAHGSARHYAQEQARAAQRMSQQGNTFIGCHVGGNQVNGIYPHNAFPLLAKATTPQAMRCQSCAAPMKHHVCAYCGTSHR